MNRRLIVLRHAKATHKPGFTDVDRPLTARGLRDADAAGEWLRDRELIPDLVLCSSALRTRETWDRVALALGAAQAPAAQGRGGQAPGGQAPGSQGLGSQAPGSEASGSLTPGGQAAGTEGQAAGNGAAGVEVRYEPRLYTADTDQALEIIAEDPGDAGTVLLVGHNPVALQIVCRLTARSDLEFPTSALAVVGLSDWDRLAPGTGMIHSLWTPKSEHD